jgi:hypothetical protein
MRKISGDIQRYVTVLAAICCVIAKVNAQPSAYPGAADVSYVRSWVATAPINSVDALISKPLKDAKQVTQFIDGQGRLLQTVSKQASYETGGTAKDLVSPMIYDEIGREQYKYLAFGSSSSDGSFKYDPFQQQSTFMQSQYTGQSETYYYSKTNFETSPLSRVEKTMAPGNNWVGSTRGADQKYWYNTSTDDVKIWTVNNNSTIGNWGSYATSGSYATGLLYKNITVDEHGKQVIEIKDKGGKVILKKVQLTAAADSGMGRGYTGWLCTYYIYDELQNLRCVIQPKGVELLAANSWAFTISILEEQCFMYEYDERNRMIVKRVPGSGRVQMVYDSKDRLVMTQDSNLLSLGKWLVTKYDALNRPEETGLWTNSNTASTHRGNAYGSNSYPTTSGTYETLTIAHYDDYSSLPSGLSSSFLTTWNTYFSSTNNWVWPYPQMPVKGNSTKGLVTWTQVKILGTSSWISSASIYDSSGKPIQVQSINVTGGLDVITTQYSWSGQPLITVQKLEKSGTNSQNMVVFTSTNYDDLGRVTRI